MSNVFSIRPNAALDILREAIETGDSIDSIGLAILRKDGTVEMAYSSASFPLVGALQTLVVGISNKILSNPEND